MCVFGVFVFGVFVLMMLCVSFVLCGVCDEMMCDWFYFWYGMGDMGEGLDEFVLVFV